MLTNITQGVLLGALQPTVGQTPAQITSVVTATLALSNAQQASFLTYITASLSAWPSVLNNIGLLTTADYNNMLPITANKTPLDVDIYTADLTELNATQQDTLAMFMLSINPINILINSTILVPVAQADYVRRQISLFPNYWAGDVAKNPGGNLWSLFNAIALLHYEVNVMFETAQQSFYLSTAVGHTLDVVVYDFYGTSLVRTPAETDDHLRARAYGRLFIPKATRPALLSALTSIAPTRLIEPWSPADTGVLDGMYYDWDTAPIPGRYTDASLRYQGFADISLSQVLTNNLFQYTAWAGGQTLPLAITVHGASQTGSSLTMTGFTPNQTNIISPGTSFLLTTGQTVTSSGYANSDGSGNVTVALSSPLTSSPADTSAVTFTQPQGIGFYDNLSYYIPTLASASATVTEVYNTILSTKAEGTMVWVRFV